MVPTYFRRELRDRVLQRPSRLRTFLFCRRVIAAGPSRSFAVLSGRPGILVHPLSRAMTAKY